MIYAIHDLEADIWYCIGDYATEYEVLSFWNLFCSSNIYRSRYLALSVIGSFDSVTGIINPLAERRRIAIHLPDEQPQRGGSCGGDSPLKSCPATEEVNKQCWYRRFVNVFFGKSAVLKSLKKKEQKDDSEWF